MIRWLMLGLVLLFSESACDRQANASSERSAKAAAGLEAQWKAAATAASTDHEDAYRLTCYTCVNVSDNKMCNEWAIDTPCAGGGGRDFCRSLHILDSRGRSVLVNKSCASRAECGPASVGCMPVDTQRICISCCDTSYCNVDSPTNSSNAAYSRRRPWPEQQPERGLGARSSASSSASSSAPAAVTALVVLLCQCLRCQALHAATDRSSQQRQQQHNKQYRQFGGRSTTETRTSILA